MARAFVTGATGFIGGHVARLLLEEGWEVRALKRPGSFNPFLRDHQPRWLEGDLGDYPSIVKACRGCEAVFHVAADYRLWAPRPAEIYANNVQGTVNVLRAARECGARRVVYTGSVGALGLREDASPADESTPVALKDMVGHYKRSKFLAEREADKFSRAGLPLVKVHPSTPVGPGDHKPTPTGKIIVDFLNRRMPAYVDTGLNLVHVRDVAKGHLLALEKGEIGEGYILGNRNMTLAEIFSVLEKISGIPAPKFSLPHFPVLAVAAANEIFSRLTGKEPLVPLEGARMARKRMFFSARKAVECLGLPQTPVEQALEEAVQWFRQNEYAP